MISPLFGRFWAHFSTKLNSKYNISLYRRSIIFIIFQNLLKRPQTICFSKFFCNQFPEILRKFMFWDFKKFFHTLATTRRVSIKCKDQYGTTSRWKKLASRDLQEVVLKQNFWQFWASPCNSHIEKRPINAISK